MVYGNGYGGEHAGDPLAMTIARTLEQDIVFGRLRPGEKLREEDLADRFSASRHQVREGLAHLERLGIAARQRNRGVSVRSFSEDEIRQIYEVREMLHRQVALRTRLPVDPAVVARLTEINGAYEEAVAAEDLQRIHGTNDQFHMEMFRLCGNDVLVGLVKQYMDLTYLIRSGGFSDPENLETSRRQHRAMLALLCETDSWALAQIYVEHIQPTKAQFLATLR